MPPLFQTRPLPHRRKPHPPLPAQTPPAPAVVHVTVRNVGGDDGRFGWFFDRPFADPTVPWTAADFAGLTIDGTAPSGIDEVIGADGDLTLIYPFATASAYAILAEPPLLVFDVMPVTLTPPAGAVV